MEKLVSTKAAGSGIGTESIRMIVEQYRGDARFEWKDGVYWRFGDAEPVESPLLFCQFCVIVSLSESPFWDSSSL